MSEKEKFRMIDSTDLSRAMVRSLDQQLESVLALCESLPENPERSVHDIRRSYKKCRALLRLFRDSMGYAAYFRENRSLRDLHRLLSPARDARVFLDMMALLGKKHPEHSGRAWFRNALGKSREHLDQLIEGIYRNKEVERISQGTLESRERIPYYLFSESGFGLIRKGLERTYRQGKNLSEAVFINDEDPLIIHTFRKKAKTLEYQQSFLIPIFPEMMKPASKSVKKLNDTLGLYHDLHKVQLRLNELTLQPGAAKTGMERFFTMVHEEMQICKRRALLLSSKLYAERPGQFLQRIKSYWDKYELYHVNV